MAGKESRSETEAATVGVERQAKDARKAAWMGRHVARAVEAAREAAMSGKMLVVAPVSK